MKNKRVVLLSDEEYEQYKVYEACRDSATSVIEVRIYHNKMKRLIEQAYARQMQTPESTPNHVASNNAASI